MVASAMELTKLSRQYQIFLLDPLNSAKPLQPEVQVSLLSNPLYHNFLHAKQHTLDAILARVQNRLTPENIFEILTTKNFRPSSFDSTWWPRNHQVLDARLFVISCSFSPLIKLKLSSRSCHKHDCFLLRAYKQQTLSQPFQISNKLLNTTSLLTPSSTQQRKSSFLTKFSQKRDLGLYRLRLRLQGKVI